MSDRLRWTMTFVVPAVFGLATIVLQGASGATLFDDEMGYIGEAVYLSARAGTPYLHGIPFYPAGYATVLALPLSIVPFDPWVVAVGTNVVLLGAIGPVLHWIVRTATAVSDRTAALAAIAGACVPSVVLQTPRAWSEVAVALGFTIWAALLLRWSRVGPARGAVTVTVAAGVLLSLHRRTVAAVAVTFLAVVVWSLWQGVRPRGTEAGELGTRLRAVPWLSMIVALVAGGATVLGALALDGLVGDELYGGVTSGNRLRKTENLQSTIWIPALLGHVWSVLATTFGLAGIGLLTLWWYLYRRTHVVFVVVVSLAVGGIVMTSVTFLANGVRADQLVYERYVAPVTPLLVALGVAALAARLPSWRWATVVSGATLAAIGLLLSISLQESRLTGNVQKFSVPTLTSLDVPAVGWAQQYAPRIHAVAITAIALTALVVAVAVARRWTTWGAVGVVALWAAVVGVGSAGNLRPFVDVWEPTGREAAAFLEARDVDVVQYAPHTRHESRNVLQYRLGFPDVALIDPSGCPPAPYFVGPPRLEESHDVVPLISVVNFPGVLYERSC